MNFALFDEEQLLQQFPNREASLTTHRVQLHRADASAAHIISILLEKVSSCEIRYLSYPWLLLVGGLVLLVGVLALFQNAGPPLVLLLLVVGALLLAAYFASRRHVVSIASDGGTRLSFETKGMAREVVLGFIDHVEQAKNQRMVQLALLIHADRSSQYTSPACQQRMAEVGAVTSYARPGNPYDNAQAKAGWSTLKTELLPGEAFASLAEARPEVAHYLDTCFNLGRHHPALGYRSLHHFEADLRNHLP